MLGHQQIGKHAMPYNKSGLHIWLAIGMHAVVIFEFKVCLLLCTLLLGWLL